MVVGETTMAAVVVVDWAVATVVVVAAALRDPSDPCRERMTATAPPTITSAAIAQGAERSTS
jgi:hypothetical protein